MSRQQWKKVGNIFALENKYSWLQTHAANPVAEQLVDDVYRIYFSGRDLNNRASIGYFEIDINRPAEILRLSKKPVVSPGDIGAFDDSGVSVACSVSHRGKKYLFYVGWNLGVTVPWRNSIGLAICEDGKTFHKYSKAPVLDRNHADPFSISYPYIMVEDNVWRMWYGSNLTWGKEQTDMAHLLKYAESNDGINWSPSGEVSVNFKDESEYAISKPSVIKEEGVYKMWYSYRGRAYRIGYAESEDGIHFQRLDERVGITVSEDGWDSESVEYPNVIVHNDVKYMFYNGNSYGKTGIGLAYLD